ncbi:MAG TPA: endonuclease/exonuclease/phosphatase family protein [Thermoanaerobaculia bacterium]|nr:endonuclease/exonuclease/phosphatase family protein [Thermoanaerobaculia bacterium]
MRIAQFNVENLFDRAAVMNLDDPKQGKPILEAFADINEHLLKPVYNAADRAAIVAALKVLGLETSDESTWAVLRQNHGRLLKRSKGQITITAVGREDWVGGVELKEAPVEETATRMTAKVIDEVGADILGIEETEGLDTLRGFNRTLLHKVQAEYDHLMSVRGNDTRPIDVALLTRNGKVIESIVSHVDDAAGGKRIFSRDCPEYTIHAGAETILVMVNHFKSQGYGKKADNDARRKAQAQRVREIYDARRADGFDNIVILGDFNDVPSSDALSPLLANGSDLRDISAHPGFVDDGRGTYADGKKLDYILFSPALFAKITGGGTLRKGMWKAPQQYGEIKVQADAASDHAALFADLAL